MCDVRRESGWYWARVRGSRQGRPEVLYWSSREQRWFPTAAALNGTHQDSDLAEIGPRIPSPADLPAGAAELRARLAELSAKATAGEWRMEKASRPSDHGYDYGILADVDGITCIAEAYEVVGTGRRVDNWSNANLIVALVNAHRAGHLDVAPTGALPDEGWNAAIEAAAIWYERTHGTYAQQIRALARPAPPVRGAGGG